MVVALGTEAIKGMSITRLANEVDLLLPDEPGPAGRELLERVRDGLVSVLEGNSDDSMESSDDEVLLGVAGRAVEYLPVPVMWQAFADLRAYRFVIDEGHGLRFDMAAREALEAMALRLGRALLRIVDATV